MYYVQDAHSFWDWIYFVLLIVVSAPFAISKYGKRDMQNMIMSKVQLPVFRLNGSTLSGDATFAWTRMAITIVRQLNGDAIKSSMRLKTGILRAIRSI